MDEVLAAATLSGVNRETRMSYKSSYERSRVAYYHQNIISAQPFSLKFQKWKILKSQASPHIQLDSSSQTQAPKIKSPHLTTKQPPVPPHTHKRMNTDIPRPKVKHHKAGREERVFTYHLGDPDADPAESPWISNRTMRQQRRRLSPRGANTKP